MGGGRALKSVSLVAVRLPPDPTMRETSRRQRPRYRCGFLRAIVKQPDGFACRL